MSMRETDPVPAVGERESLSRKDILRGWKEARYEDIVRYGSGTNIDLYGRPFRHDSGARLVILGNDVMDKCETPWANATVDKAFAAVGEKENVEVLERGFGMGIVATRVIQHLGIRKGNYTCIELNDQVAEHADKDWREKQGLHKQIAQGVMGEDSNKDSIGIRIIRGDAVEQTQRLANKGKKFDIIISDTFPLSDDEEGVNDILDLDTVLQCLNPDGVFAFFGYHPGLEGSLDNRQRSLVERHFDKITIDQVDVRPPKSYGYLNTPVGAVTKLPVIICTKPIIHKS